MFSLALSLVLVGWAAAPSQETVLKDSELAKLGDAMAEWLEARKSNEGIGEAMEQIHENLDALSKRAKTDLLALPADLGRAWWLSNKYDKQRLKEGKVADDVLETGDFNDMPYVYSVPKKYDPRKGSYPVILCAHGEDQRPEDHLKEDWLDSTIIESAILIAPQLPENREAWSVTFQMEGGQRLLGGLGSMLMAFRVATEKFAVDFDRVYVSGRGAGVELALQTADLYADRFAGMIGRNGDPGEMSAGNFGNLPTLFVAAGARATAFEEKAKELGFNTVTLSMNASEADIWAWILEHPRKAYPEEIVFYPRDKSLRAYWLQVAPEDTSAERKIVARIERGANKLILESDTISQVVVYFNDVMFDLDKPIVVEANGITNEISIPRDIQRTLGYFFNARSDPGRVFVYDDAISIPPRAASAEK